MKRKFLIVIAALITVYACSKKNTSVEANTPKQGRTIDLSSYALMGLDSPFLLPDTANVMIESYLTSIEDDPTQLKSLIVDANSLRYYLQNTDITHVKLMFAHKLSYIREGNNGEPAGLDYNALTIVIAGFDENNDYIYSPQGAVMDFCKPCPFECPSTGTAANDLLND